MVGFRTAFSIMMLMPTFGTTAALARDNTGFITAGASMDAPRGYSDMCRRMAGPLCEADSRAPVAIMASVDDHIVPVDATSAILTDAGVSRANPLRTHAIRDFGQVVRSGVVVALPASLSPTNLRSTVLDQPLYAMPSDSLLPAGSTTDDGGWNRNWKISFATTLVQPELAAIPSLADFVRRAMEQAVEPSTLAPVFVSAPATIMRPAQEAAAIARLKSVNRYVNDRVIQRTDLQMFGRGEVWRRSGTQKGAMGDCEDLAIEKRLQLIEQGFPEDRLFFAVVYRGDIGLHTVLVARLRTGDVVLDSRTQRIAAWKDAPYSWISVQNPGRPAQWFVPTRETITLARNGSAKNTDG